MRGKTEALFSVIKKISLTNTNRKFKNVKIKASKSDGYLNTMKNGKV